MDGVPASTSVRMPESAMTTSSTGRSPEEVLVDSMALTTSMPSTTRPKTTWRPSSHGVLTVVMKNWEPFESGPAFACVSVA